MSVTDLTTYTGMKAAVADLINRTDLTDAIPAFLALAEADMKRQLHRTTARQQYTINAQSWTMPAEIDTLESLRFVTASPSSDLPIIIGTPETVAEFRALRGDTAGKPQTAFVVGRDVIFAPTPDTAYTLEATYVVALTALSGSVSTNAVLAEAPDAYLYGAAVHAAPYLGDDERIGLWQGLYQKAIDQLNAKRDREQYGASLRPARLPRVFG